MFKVNGVLVDANGKPVQGEGEAAPEESRTAQLEAEVARLKAEAGGPRLPDDARKRLLDLPNMTEQRADAILAALTAPSEPAPSAPAPEGGQG